MTTEGERLYRLYIRRLEVPLRVGIHAFEKLGPQRVLLDVTLWARFNPDAPPDRLAGVVDYEAIVQGIRSMAVGEHINLLETLADRVAALCFAHERVMRVRVSAAKPDIFEDAEAVGVEIERVRPGSATDGAN